MYLSLPGTIIFKRLAIFSSRSKEIVRALLENNLDVNYCQIESELGHDSFLLPIRQYHRIIGAYAEQVNISK